MARPRASRELRQVLFLCLNQVLGEFARKLVIRDSQKVSAPNRSVSRRYRNLPSRKRTAPK